MAKKPASTPAKAASKAAPVAAPAKSAAKPASAAVSSTAVRNSPVPVAAKVASTVKAPVTYDAIAYRAFELYQHGRPGGPMDHWLAAETELRGK